MFSLGGSDYPDVEFGVLLFNSSQQTRNVSIPIISSKLLRVSLRLLSDGFSCAAVEPSTAHIIILDTTDDDNDAVCNCVDDMNGKDKGTCSKPAMSCGDFLIIPAPMPAWFHFAVYYFK
jgi:hypothetical protein